MDIEHHSPPDARHENASEPERSETTTSAAPHERPAALPRRPSAATRRRLQLVIEAAGSGEIPLDDASSETESSPRPPIEELAIAAGSADTDSAASTRAITATTLLDGPRDTQAAAPPTGHIEVAGVSEADMTLATAPAGAAASPAIDPPSTPGEPAVRDSFPSAKTSVIPRLSRRPSLSLRPRERLLSSRHSISVPAEGERFPKYGKDLSPLGDAQKRIVRGLAFAVTLTGLGSLGIAMIFSYLAMNARGNALSTALAVPAAGVAVWTLASAWHLRSAARGDSRTTDELSAALGHLRSHVILKAIVLMVGLASVCFVSSIVVSLLALL